MPSVVWQDGCWHSKKVAAISDLTTLGRKQEGGDSDKIQMSRTHPPRKRNGYWNGDFLEKGRSCSPNLRNSNSELTRIFCLAKKGLWWNQFHCFVLIKNSQGRAFSFELTISITCCVVVASEKVVYSGCGKRNEVPAAMSGRDVADFLGAFQLQYR